MLTTPDNVEQAPRSSDNEVSSHLQGPNLWTLTDSTKDGGDAKRKMPRVFVNIFFDLHDKLASRNHNQSTDSAMLGRIRCDQGKKRKNKGCCLTCAGLGDAHQVVPLENNRNGCGLNGGRFGISSVFDRLIDLSCEA